MTAESAAGRSRAALLLLPVFFLSGFAALVYQTIWQRVLTLFSGADALAVTLIVAAFMAGLGCGSLAGSRWADRLSLRRRFLVFALAEAAVGAFAWVSLPLYYNVLYRYLGAHPLPEALVGLVLFATLLWPTFFMGLSLPLLARTIGPTGKKPEDWVGQLYGFNTLGAASGALISVWYLVRQRGFEGSVHIAAGLNLACALVAFVLARVVPEEAAPTTTNVPQQPEPEAAAGSFGFSTWTLLFGLSGFVALSLEILWFRVLGVILKSNAFTFATLLSIYLLGVGGGALLGSRWARRSRQPAQVFLLLQALIPAYAALALAILVRGVGDWPELNSYLGGYETLDLRRALPALAGAFSWSTLDQQARGLVRLFGLLYGFVPLALFGPPTLLMGLSFPFLQKATQTDPNVLGRRVGVLQAANILGCTLGSIVTGMLLLGRLGTAGTLRLLVGLGALFLILFATSMGALSGRRRRVLALAGAAPFVLAALVLSPGSRELWAALHGAAAEDVLAGEDGSGLSVLRDVHDGGLLTTVVFAGGLGQSALPYGGEHTLLGAFPVLLHPAPHDVAIVGLGSGDTLFGAAARRATTQLDCIEIVEPQLASLRALDRTHAYAGLRLLLADPRVHFLNGDGREFLMRSARRYDVIEADALRPTSAFSGSIYSLEYFSMLRERLKPGGYAVTWGPTSRVRDTFRRAFPHVLELNQVLVGSEDAVRLDLGALQARLDEPFTREHFARGQVDMAGLMGEFLQGVPEAYGPIAPGHGPADLDTDLYPRDEYLVPRRAPRHR